MSADYLGMGPSSSLANMYLDDTAKMSQIAHEDASTAQIQAETQLTQLKAKQAQRDYNTQAQLAQLAQLSAPEDKPASMGELADQISQVYLKSGQPEKALSIQESVTKFQDAHLDALAKQEANQIKSTAQQAKNYEQVAQMLGAAQTQQDVDMIKQVVLSRFPDAKKLLSLPEMQNLTPEKAQTLSRGLMKYKDGLEVKEKERHNEQMEMFKGLDEERNERKADSMKELNDARIEEARARADKLRKAGGSAGLKPVGAPTKSEMSVAEEGLTKLGVKPSEGDIMEVAQHAKFLVRNNAGLTQAAATAKVIGEMIQDKKITPEQKGDSLFDRWFGKGKEGKPAEIHSPLNPQPISKEDVAAGKMVEGQYYSTPKGVVRYLGKGKAALISTGDRTGFQSSSDDDSDDDGEGEGDD